MTCGDLAVPVGPRFPRLAALGSRLSVFNWATALSKAIKAATHDDVMTSRIRNAEWGMPNAQNRGRPWEEGLVGLPGVKRGVLLEGQ